MRLFIAFLLVACFTAVAGAAFEDAVKKYKYNQAVRLYRAEGMHNTQHAFELLWEAWDETDDAKLRKQIKDMLQKTYKQYCSEVSEHTYILDDLPQEEDEGFYDMLINYGKNARAYRLKGQLLIKQKKYEQALLYLKRANDEGDSEAATWIALCCAYGHGIESNPSLAFKWLERGTSLGSPLANELMAKMLWDANTSFGVPNNRAGDVAHYLEQTLHYMERWTLGDPQKEQERKNDVTRIRNAIDGFFRPLGEDPEQMEQWTGLRDCQPMFEIFLIDAYYENALYWVYKGLELCCTYLGPPGTQVDLKKIRFVALSKDPTGNSYGITTRKYPEDDTVMNKIEIFLDELPPVGKTSQQYWWRRLYYLDTLVHEMAHVYFSQRYRAIPAFGSDLNCKRTYEGHATNAAYLFIKNAFFRGHLTPDQYAEMFCSNAYKKYFFWFREECMSPGEDVYWKKIDHWEREAARELGYKDYEVKTRRQVPWQD